MSNKRKTILILLFLFVVDVVFAKKTEESFFSLKFNEVNARTGPSSDFPVILIYKTKFLPVKAVAEYDNWYRIVDMDDDGGWVMKHLLSNYRTIITKKGTIVYSSYHEKAYQKYRVEKNVILKLVRCKEERCRVSILYDGKKDSGWINKGDMWGVE
jgi:SH3-like domain-containing protein